MRVSKTWICAAVLTGVAGLCLVAFRTYRAAGGHDRLHRGGRSAGRLRDMVLRARAHVALTEDSAFPDFADHQAVVMYFAEQTERYLYYLKENDMVNHVKHLANAMIAYPQSERLDRLKSGAVMDVFEKRLETLCAGGRADEPPPSPSPPADHSIRRGVPLYLQ